LKLFLVKHVLGVIYRLVPFEVIGDKMKINHNQTNSHNGNGASNMNEKLDPSKYNGSAEYLASAIGLKNLNENTHPATYGVRINKVI
jgi:hypothetical protein